MTSLNNIHLHPADPEKDFRQLAEWFTILEGDPNTESGLRDYYAKNQQRITQCLADDEQGNRLGFYWLARGIFRPKIGRLAEYVSPEWRGQGLGSHLLHEATQAAKVQQIQYLRVKVWDNDPGSCSFLERRGFLEQSHLMGMTLNLVAFDDRPYDKIIARLQGEGFQFTSMEALGNTEDAQRKLYELNETTGMEAPGSEGMRSWTSFEDFQQSVCHADWFKPAGQMVAIDSATGIWAGMSAITRFDDFAYNLHTGVDKRYRNRKLGQAVKITALRYAREVLKVETVRTHHNSFNAPMIAIDRKFGYLQTLGTYTMEKDLTQL